VRYKQETAVVQIFRSAYMAGLKARTTTVAMTTAAVMTALGCGGSAPPAQTSAPAAQAGPVTIDVVRVVEQPVNVTLSMPGQLDPYELVAVYPKVTGFVKAITVDRGSRVRTGEVLATLEAPELSSQRAEAQSKVQAANAQLAVTRAKGDADASTYDRLKAASATPGAVAGNDLVLAQKSVEADRSLTAAAEQNVEAARQALQAVSETEAYLKVVAPFDGVVTERNVHPGALVGPGGGAAAQPMVRLMKNDRLRLVVPVPEAYAGDVTRGAPLTFTVSAYPGQTFTGTIARTAQAVDVRTRTMAVELDVANRDGRLAAGTFCQVQWPVHRATPSLFVPSASVASTTDRTFVIRIRNGKTEWVDVKTGLTSGPLIEVFGDLRAGDQVAGRGTDEIRPGTAVRLKEVKAEG
jgi:membrane fusion protein (multidrug efflux system)